MLATYRRSGGPKPRSDELVVVDDSGEATVRRVVNVDRVGTFRAQVSPSDVASLRKLVDAAAKATVTLQAPGRPPFETEEIETAGGTLRFHPAQKLPKPIAALRDRLVELGQDALDSPVAGVELTIDPKAGAVRLATLGSTPIEADWSGAAATYDLFGANEALLTSGEIPLALPAGRQQLGLGWSHAPKLPAMDFEPSMTLQVRLAFQLKYADDSWRDAQITVVAGKGWE